MTVHLTTTVDEGVLDVDGAQVRYYASGEPELTRPPIVLVHGTGGSTDGHFGFLFPMLAMRQHVISLDMAQPIDVAELTVDHLERQVDAVVAQLVPAGPVAILGYSLGSVVAASYAAHRADRVTRLVLIAGWAKTDHHQTLRNDLYQKVRSIGDPDLMKAYSRLFAFGVPFLAKRSPGEMDAVAPGRRPTEFSAMQMELNRSVDITGLLDSIAAKTLIIGGTHDLMVPRHHSLGLFGAIANARYTEISSGHSMFVERPAEVLSMVNSFLAEPDRFPAGSVIPTPEP